MCMKYVNANIQCFDGRVGGLFGSFGFSSMLESVRAEEKDGNYIIGGFNIVTFINIRGTNNLDVQDNPINNKQKLHFRLRLTKLSENKEEQISYNLKDFVIDLSKSDNIHKACFDYVERVEVVNVNQITLNSAGAYVIKLLVKDENKEKYDIQMVHPLYVK